MPAASRRDLPRLFLLAKASALPRIRQFTTISGIKMLIYQAIKSFEIWTGRSVSAEAMLHAAMNELERS